jgi:hypothetical protein
MKSGWAVILVMFFLLPSVSCRAQVPGCTDPMANNYDPSATMNDGSCTYDPVSISPKHTYSLNDEIKETSGLILWDGYLWTHNDNEDNVLYGLDTTTADIERTYALPGVENQQWEEISQDQYYIYLGDFGNNNSGNRSDLHILKIRKSSLIAGSPVIDTIWYSYSDQTDLNPSGANYTDFDCEAMIVSDDSIYLFTKQWVSAQTTLYRLPKDPGNHTAIKKEIYNVRGLVTGATYLESERLVVLCGYTSLLFPFFTILYDFNDHDFFSGNKRRITVSLPFHQIEGIATQNGLRYYATNESFAFQQVTYSPHRMHLFDLSPFLEDYLPNRTSNTAKSEFNGMILIYPNPVYNKITVKIDRELSPAVYEIYDLSSRIVAKGILFEEVTTVDISHLVPGFFTFAIGDHHQKMFSILKYQ